MRKRRVTLEANQFRGLNEAAKTRNMPEFFRSGHNFVVTDEGYIEKIWGSKKIFEGHNFDEIYSLYWHKEDNSVLLATGLEGSDYKMKAYTAGAWADLSLPADVGSKHFDNYPVWYASYLNEPYVFTGELSLVYRSRTTKLLEDLDTLNRTWFLANGGSEENYIPIRGISPVVHFNALWLAGVGDWKNTLIYSSNFSNIFYRIRTGNIPRINYLSVGGDDTAASATLDEITGLVEWGPELIVFKNDSIHRVTGYTSAQFVALPINDDIGSKFPQSIQRTRAGVIFLDDLDSGIWMLSGAAPRNISKPKVDALIREIGPEAFIRSGVYKDRYYMLSLGLKTLIYDTNLDTWAVEDENYGAFTKILSTRDIFLAAYNTYSTTKQTVTDPARPGEPQEVLQKIATASDIVELGVGNKRFMDADGTGGDDIELEAYTPYMDTGTRRVKKTFYEVMAHFKSGEKVLYMDLDIDGRVYPGLTGVIDSRPLYNEAYYNEEEYDHIPLYEALFRLPVSATGYSISMKFYSTSGKRLRIEDYVVYFLPRGNYNEERE